MITELSSRNMLMSQFNIAVLYYGVIVDNRSKYGGDPKLVYSNSLNIS